MANGALNLPWLKMRQLPSLQYALILFTDLLESRLVDFEFWEKIRFPRLAAQEVRFHRLAESQRSREFLAEDNRVGKVAFIHI